MPPSEGTRTVQFRAGRDSSGLLADLERRASSRLSIDLVARRDVGRYYHALRQSLPRFARGEAMAILDVCNGTLFDTWSVPLLWANVADTDGLSEKWQIDQSALVARLRGLTYFEALAVVDAAERFWLHADVDSETALLASGLLREEDQ